MGSLLIEAVPTIAECPFAKTLVKHLAVVVEHVVFPGAGTGHALQKSSPVDAIRVLVFFDIFRHVVFLLSIALEPPQGRLTMPTLHGQQGAVQYSPPAKEIIAGNKIVGCRVYRLGD